MWPADCCLLAWPSLPWHWLACRPDREQTGRRAGLSAPGNVTDAARRRGQEEREKEEATGGLSPPVYPAEERMGDREESCHLRLELKMDQFGVQLECRPACKATPPSPKSLYFPKAVQEQVQREGRDHLAQLLILQVGKQA